MYVYTSGPGQCREGDACMFPHYKYSPATNGYEPEDQVEHLVPINPNNPNSTDNPDSPDSPDNPDHPNNPDNPWNECILASHGPQSQFC